MRGLSTLKMLNPHYLLYFKPGDKSQLRPSQANLQRIVGESKFFTCIFDIGALLNTVFSKSDFFSDFHLFNGWAENGRLAWME